MSSENFLIATLTNMEVYEVLAFSMTDLWIYTLIHVVI